MVNEKPELALKWQFVTGGGVIGLKSIIGLLGLCAKQKSDCSHQKFKIKAGFKSTSTPVFEHCPHFCN